MDRRTWRIVRSVVLVVIVAVGLVLSQRDNDRLRAPPIPAPVPAPVEQPAPAPAERPAPAPPKNASDALIRNVTVKDLDGGIAFQGDIDLRKTLARIDAGKRLKFRNDGAVFENREKRLPSRKSGYYHEWVHPTPGLDGPGPQRVVVGAQGETYYTRDHYRSFDRVR